MYFPPASTAGTYIVHIENVQRRRVKRRFYFHRVHFAISNKMRKFRFYSPFPISRVFLSLASCFLRLVNLFISNSMWTNKRISFLDLHFTFFCHYISLQNFQFNLLYFSIQRNIFLFLISINLKLISRHFSRFRFAIRRNENYSFFFFF